MFEGSEILCQEEMELDQQEKDPELEGLNKDERADCQWDPEANVFVQNVALRSTTR